MDIPSVPASPARILVLGIGNILWADEGFGVRAVEAFHKAYEVPDNVTILDGGTQGLYLVQFVNEHERLIVFDAIDYALKPGTMKVLEDDEVPKFIGSKKMSLHQTGFQEVLSAADLMGHYPKRLILIGCQPLDLEDWGGPLTAPVKAAIPAAVKTAVEILKRWGVAVSARPEGSVVPPLLENDIDLENYERRPEVAAPTS
ncbi:hydrogenase expression/formation protein HupD (plasmid) [Rhizobium sp. NXC14]|uniref:HyaD/HybD family hydrogenase maturation endopeptidase n=1 Tax=Rhizobium sp. NXC14 TaxID=1981173 RepID=UPI000A20BB16|nr:HyaD/HybD family hydrogenase maturation endopeptidase [Rhizobium sp. NXC14]ARO32718.1 hydrogenase expression/formation protein HupD [Rhizobium sp. NXC14]